MDILTLCSYIYTSRWGAPNSKYTCSRKTIVIYIRLYMIVLYDTYKMTRTRTTSIIQFIYLPVYARERWLCIVLIEYHLQMCVCAYKYI